MRGFDCFCQRPNGADNPRERNALEINVHLQAEIGPHFRSVGVAVVADRLQLKFVSRKVVQCFEKIPTRAIEVEIF